MHAIIEFVSVYRAWFWLAAIVSITVAIGVFVAHFAGVAAGAKASVAFVFVLVMIALWAIANTDWSK